MERNFPKKSYYRVDEIARYFDISQRTIYRLIEEGVIRAIRIRDSIRVPASEIKRLERRR